MISLTEIREPLNRLREVGKGERWALIDRSAITNKLTHKKYGWVIFLPVRDKFEEYIGLAL